MYIIEKKKIYPSSSPTSAYTVSVRYTVIKYQTFTHIQLRGSTKIILKPAHSFPFHQVTSEDTQFLPLHILIALQIHNPVQCLILTPGRGGNVTKYRVQALKHTLET